MLGNIKIGYNNLIDAATLTASPAMATELPISNIQNINRGKVIRCGGTQTITATFSSPQTIGMVALWCPTGVWGNNSFTVILRNAANTQLGGTINSVKTSAFFTPVASVSKVEITITASGTFKDISRIFIGNYFEPVNNIEFGFSMKYRDLSTNERTEDGSLHITKKAKFRTLSFSLADIGNSDRVKLSSLVADAGTQNDVFVSIFSEGTGDDRRDFEMLGIFEDGAELSLTSANRWSNKLVVNEL
jgi:hypothetical protein